MLIRFRHVVEQAVVLPTCNVQSKQHGRKSIHLLQIHMKSIGVISPQLTQEVIVQPKKPYRPVILLMIMLIFGEHRVQQAVTVSMVLRKKDYHFTTQVNHFCTYKDDTRNTHVYGTLEPLGFYVSTIYQETTISLRRCINLSTENQFLATASEQEANSLSHTPCGPNAQLRENLGYVWPSPTGFAQTAIYKCGTSSNNFASLASDCEGNGNGELLGYGFRKTCSFNDIGVGGLDVAEQATIAWVSGVVQLAVQMVLFPTIAAAPLGIW